MSKYSKVVNLFLELVQIDSPTGEEKEISDWIFNWLKNIGLDPVRDRHNNVFVKTKGVGEPLFLNAHTDTVEPGRSVKPVIKDRVITSDGTTILGADNKVSVACLLDLLESRNEECRPLEILFTTSEEQGNYGAIGFDRSKIKAIEGYVFDVFDEVGTVIVASPFYARFDVSIKGSSAHAGYPEKTRPAIPVMLEVINKLEGLRRNNVLINIGQISGGESRNTVIGRMDLRGEVRSFYKVKFYKTIELLKSILGARFDVKVDYEVVIENPGYFHDQEKVKFVQKKVEKILSKDIRVEESYGCSDANIFNDGQTDLVVFNLGTGIKDPHTVDERVSVKNVNKLSFLIKELASSKD